MFSKLDFKSNLTASMKDFTGQVSKVSEDGTKGKNNLVVDGSGVGNITTQADESVVLIAEGDDIVFAESDWNTIETQAGNNTITANGKGNVVSTDHGNNNITINSSATDKDNKNIITTNHGNNQIKVTGDWDEVSTNHGDNKIVVKGGENTVATDNGNNQIKVTGNVNIVHTDNGDNWINLDGQANTLTTNHGNNDISAIGADGEYRMSNGDNQIVAVGSDVEIYSDNGDNNIYAFGNKNTISTESGSNLIFAGGDENTIITQGGKINKITVGGYTKTETGYMVDGEGNGNTIINGDSDTEIKVTGNKNKITSGKGEDVINVFGNGNEVHAGDGKNGVLSEGNGNKIYTGNGNDTVISRGHDNTVATGDGDDVINTTGNGNTISATGGYNRILSEGDGNTINGGRNRDEIVSGGAGNTINGGAGDDYIFSAGIKNTIDAGKGNDYVLSLGDGSTIGGGDGNNTIVFDGNHLNVTAGNGDNYIATLDFAIQDGAADAKYSEFLEDQIETRFSSELLSEEKGTEEVNRTSKTNILSQTTTAQGSIQANIFNQLPADEQKTAQSLDFSRQAANGRPMYVLAQAKDGKYHIYQYESGSTYRALKSSLASIGSYRLTFGGSTQTQGTQKVTTTTISNQTVTVYEQDVTNLRYADTMETLLVGNKDINVEVGNGNSTMKLNVSEDLTVNKGDGNNNIFVTGEIVLGSETVESKGKYYVGDQRNYSYNTDAKTTTTTGTQTKNITVANTGSRTYDPIVVDFNRNGSISAVSGRGVDVDNNGTVDGAATSGDKMLAMSDINGNGRIDGNEVFGNATVSPFTGKALNAANGFEALKMIAKEAEQKTGISCLKNGEVNLAQLNKALNTVGRSIGFISDGNVTELEGLEHVASINVEQYADMSDSGTNVSLKQRGTYTDTEGNKWQAGDFWFKSKEQK